MDLQKYNKAWVGAVAVLLFAVLKHYNIQLDSEIQSAVEVLLTGGLIYLVPNKS